jgi:hypothetical protein
MLSMDSTARIRRYVIVRYRDHATASSRWSMERVAPSEREAPSAPAQQQPPHPRQQAERVA